MVADRGAFAPCASGVVRGGRQWRHRSPYDDVKAGQRYVTQAWREVDRSPTALLFIPFLAPSLVEYFFLEDYVASIRRLDRIEPPLPCFFFFSFSFLPFSHFPSSNFFKSHASDSSVRKIRKFEINGMKVRDERFGEKFWRFDGGWMFRDLEFLERIGRSFFDAWCVCCGIIITKCREYLQVVNGFSKSYKYKV